jgi:hypothetical protein
VFGEWHLSRVLSAWPILVTSSSIIKDIESICATRFVSAAYFHFDFRDTKKQDRRPSLFPLSIAPGLTVVTTSYKACGEGIATTRGDCPSSMSKRRSRTLWSCHVYIIADAVHESSNKPGTPSPCEKALRLVKSWLIYAILIPDIRLCLESSRSRQPNRP